MVYTNRKILLATILHVLDCDWPDQTNEPRLLSYDKSIKLLKVQNIRSTNTNF